MISSVNGKSVNLSPLNTYDVELRYAQINNSPPGFNISLNQRMVCRNISYDEQALSRQQLE